MWQLHPTDFHKKRHRQVDNKGKTKRVCKVKKRNRK